MREPDGPILDEFGKLMIEHVHEKPIDDQQHVVSGRAADRASKSLYRAIESLELQPEQFEVVGRLIMNAVETTMGN
jgi:hypothetical protein